MKRMFAFYLKKSSKQKVPSLSICYQSQISIKPEPNLATTLLPSIEIPPTPNILEKPLLKLQNCQSTSIPPRPVYHPNIVNACQAMFTKHPSQLLPEEVTKFDFYTNMKIRYGEPLESEVIYLPIGGIRTCLNCGELT